MELNAEQIIKALEWCSELRLCVDCPMRAEGYFSHSGNACRQALMKNALALIKELTEVVEQSETARGRKESIDNGFSPSVTELQRENERLRAELEQRPPKLIITKLPKKRRMKMFDRKAYGQKYSREKRERRKAEGRCVTCGVKLTFECTTLQCEHCREKQKYQNVAKVNISKLIAEAKADTVRKMQERLKSTNAYITHNGVPAITFYMIDQIAKEMLEGASSGGDTCIRCGEIIPEGRQVCPKCEEGWEDK